MYIRMQIYGRRVLLLSCDASTAAWYAAKGIRQNPLHVATGGDAAPPTPLQVAPPNGFGDDTDLYALGLRLEPGKYERKEHAERSQQVLRFKVHLLCNGVEDMTRDLILNYNLFDDTLSIFEPPVRNSGQDGGLFLTRGRYKKYIEVRAPRVLPLLCYHTRPLTHNTPNQHPPTHTSTEGRRGPRRRAGREPLAVPAPRRLPAHRGAHHLRGGHDGRAPLPARHRRLRGAHAPRARGHGHGGQPPGPPRRQRNPPPAGRGFRLPPRPRRLPGRRRRRRQRRQRGGGPGHRPPVHVPGPGPAA